jgi:hypothetical protein
VTRRRTTAAAALAALALLGACAETTVDTTDTTDVVVDSSSTVPTGTTAELLERLITETSGLSELVVEGEGEIVALASIEALWAAARPGVEEERPELLDQFDDAMAYARRAVERRRPADADKAAQNLRTLTNAL